MHFNILLTFFNFSPNFFLQPIWTKVESLLYTPNKLYYLTLNMLLRLYGSLAVKEHHTHINRLTVCCFSVRVLRQSCSHHTHINRLTVCCFSVRGFSAKPAKWVRKMTAFEKLFLGHPHSSLTSVNVSNITRISSAEPLTSQIMEQAVKSLYRYVND